MEQHLSKLLVNQEHKTHKQTHDPTDRQRKYQLFCNDVLQIWVILALANFHDFVGNKSYLHYLVQASCENRHCCMYCWEKFMIFFNSHIAAV